MGKARGFTSVLVRIPSKEHKDLEYLGTQQCRVISGPPYITKSVESRLYAMHDCLRIARCSRKETSQVRHTKLDPLEVLAFVRAIGIEQQGITCHKLPFFLMIGKRLLNAKRDVRLCA